MAKYKMTVRDKEDRKGWKLEVKALGAVIVHNKQTTIVYKEYGNVTKFATSVHSPSDPRDEFNRKYGELLALARFLDGATVSMASGDFMEMVYAMNMYTQKEHKENAKSW